MPRTPTASDRAALIRLASTMPVGAPKRRAILAALSKTSAHVDLPKHLYALSAKVYAEYKRALDGVKDEVLRKWPALIEKEFEAHFPLWELEVRMEFFDGETYGDPGDSDRFRLSLLLYARESHPQHDAARSVVPTEEAKAIDRWFHSSFGLDTDFEARQFTASTLDLHW